MKLSNVTFTLQDKAIESLLWCNKQKRAKRNKPVKINGVLLSDVQVFHEL